MVYFLQIGQPNRATAHAALTPYLLVWAKHRALPASHGYGLAHLGRVTILRTALFLFETLADTTAPRSGCLQRNRVWVDFADVERVEGFAPRFISISVLLSLGVELVRLHVRQARRLVISLEASREVAV